jgi:hypothetical protein
MLLVSAGIGGSLWLSKRGHERHEAEIAERALSRALRDRGLEAFSIDEVLGDGMVSRAAVRKACLAVYSSSLRRALLDLTVSEQERGALDLLGTKLRLSRQDAEQLERTLKRDTYARELERRLADGKLTTDEMAELRRMRASLGLADVEAFSATQQSVTDSYRALFRRFAEDGRLLPPEVEKLREFAAATGMSPEQAAAVSHKDALSLYRRTVAMMCQDGIVTDDDARALSVLEEVLRLRPADVWDMRREVERVAELGRVRSGQMPAVRVPGLLLETTEVCRWHGKCRYRYETKTGPKEFVGQMTATDRRVIFNSPERSFSFAIRKILNVGGFAGGVTLSLSVTKGQGRYFVEDSEMLEAILLGLVRRCSFAIAEGSDSSRSRHIPDHVRVEVWQRDGGGCVRCGAQDYLEFDHVIPFSRGGSNSTENVQLLCRRCNLAKGGELV